MTLQVVYIALDFDGVLHHHCAGPNKVDHFNAMAGVPAFKNMLEERFTEATEAIDYFDADGRLFDREHCLESLLRRLSNAKIILSTSWRHKISYEHLPGFLSCAVQERIVGVLDYAENESMSEGVRGTLMAKWMKDNGTSDASWFALDDQPSHYKFHPEHLIRTHWRGMDDNTVAAAIKKTEELSEKSASEITA